MTSLDLSARPTRSRQGATPPPSAHVETAIPKWKQSLITIIPAWLLSSLLAPVMNVWVPQWPFLVTNLIITVILVIALTYLILPFMTRLLHGWLVSSHHATTPRRTRRGQRQAMLSPRVQLLILLVLTMTLTFFVTQTQPSALAAAPVSPLVWGTNLSLYNAQDFFLTNQATVKLTQQMHVQLIRFPYRGDLAVTTAAARQIAAIHATPLLILPYGVEQEATDQTLIQMMNSIFSNQTVYYEYGNEMDLSANGGVSATAYAASWNTVIAQVKQLARAGRFIGPATFQADATYLTTFLKQAHPRPDVVSWHEYTCNSKDPDTTCLQAISRWGTHIQQAHTAMQQAIGTILPIAITEYNWNPNAQNDPRAINKTFLGTWMSAAIAELIRDQVFAANHSVLTNNAHFAMVADNTHTLTAAGIVFQNTFEQAQAQMQTPPATTTPLATNTPTTSKGSPTQLCFQAQKDANSQSRWFCVPLVNASGQSMSPQPVGTLCFPLYPAMGQQPPATINTVCVPVYEGNAPGTPTSSPTVAPSPTSTSGTNGGSPTPIPTVVPSPAATNGMVGGSPTPTPTNSGAATPPTTPTPEPSASPTPIATVTSMPTPSVIPLLTPSPTP
jgi:hypothetical protein